MQDFLILFIHLCSKLILIFLLVIYSRINIFGLKSIRCFDGFLTLFHKFVGTIIVQVNFSLKSFVNFSHFSLESFANFSPKHWYFSVNFLYFSHLCMLMVKCMHQHSLIVPTEKKFYSCVTNDKLWKIFTLGCCKSCLWPRTFWLLFFPLLFNNVLIF